MMQLQTIVDKPMRRKTSYNSNYPKVAVQCLNQALWFHKNLWLTESEMLRNRFLRVAATRCMPSNQEHNINR